MFLFLLLSPLSLSLSLYSYYLNLLLTFNNSHLFDNIAIQILFKLHIYEQIILSKTDTLKRERERERESENKTKRNRVQDCLQTRRRKTTRRKLHQQDRSACVCTRPLKITLFPSSLLNTIFNASITSASATITSVSGNRQKKENPFKGFTES